MNDDLANQPRILKRNKKKHSHTLGGRAFTIPAAARELDISEPTLRRAIKSGEVRTVQFGKLARVPISEIARIRALFDTEPQ